MHYASSTLPSFCTGRAGARVACKFAPRWALVLGLLVASCVWAQAHAGSRVLAEPPVSDFAYGLVLEVDGDGAIYEATLPDDFYRKVTRADLGDVRVYNSHDEPVPIAIRPLPASRAPEPAPVDLPLFPVYSAAGDRSSAQLHVTTDSGGRVIDVSGPGPAGNGNAGPSGYVIDASALERPAGKLRLRWARPGGQADRQTGFVATVRVQGSDDARHWATLSSQATVADLEYDAHRLEHSLLTLPARRFRYLKLSWPLGRKGVSLRSVQALFPRLDVDEARRWTRVGGHRVQGQSGVYEFDSGGFFPVDRLEVRFPQYDTLVDAEIDSRAGPGRPWLPRFEGPIYRLRIEGLRVDSPPIALDARTDRQWRLRIEGPSGALPAGIPVLRLGWVPQQILFVARGEAPFTLAYGSARAAGGYLPPAALRRAAGAASAGFIKTAPVGARVELGGSSPLAWSPDVSRRLAWAGGVVLGLGVLAGLLRRGRRRRRETGAASD